MEVIDRRGNSTFNRRIVAVITILRKILDRTPHIWRFTG